MESGHSNSCRAASSRSAMSVSVSRKRWQASGDSHGGVFNSIWLSAQSAVKNGLSSFLPSVSGWAVSASSPEAVQRRLSRSTPILQLARPRNASPAARMIDFPFSFSAISVWFFMVSSS